MVKQASSPVKQNEFSIWTVLAIVQSILWLFVLPDLCRPWWSTFWAQVPSDMLKEVILNQATTMTFISYGIFILPIYHIQHPFFEQFKILTNKKWPWLDESVEKRHSFWLQTRKSIKLCLFNLLVFIPSITLLYSYVSSKIGIEVTSYGDSDWPSKAELIRHNTLLTVIHELGFHLAHRLMHSYPFLYKYHKVHHEYKSNVFLAAQHNHPVDYLISIAAPVVVAILIVRPHSITQSQWTIYTLFANLDDHVGYSFPWSPVRWFPGAGLTQEHEFHHCVNLGCYSSKLNIFEKLFKTDRHYLIWEQKQKRM